jgi:hypothetical protein
MDREAIEFHDSVLSRIDQTGEQVRLSFEPAYVHRSSGDPGRDAGTGWSVNVELTVFGSVPRVTLPHLPGDVWDGGLRINDLEFENVVPLPFESTGDISLALELTSGELVQVTGTRAALSVVGQYEFVENVPAG